MSALLQSQEFTARYRRSLRRDRLIVLAAIVPAGTYLIQRIVREGRPLPGLTARIDEIVFWILAAWFGLMLFIVGRITWKKAGLACPQCNTGFKNSAFDAVLKRGKCPNCNAQVLSDVSAAASLASEDLVFQYPRQRAIVMLASLPIVGGIGMLMVVGFGGMLFESDLSLTRALAGLALISMGLLALALVTILAPTWRSLLTKYVVNPSGVTSLYRGLSTFHQWDRLESARYGRLTKMLILRFRGEATPVVISNSDEDPEATTLKLAKVMVEEKCRLTIRSALL